MSRTAVIADVIRTQARQLKMPGLARSFEDLARQAREEHWAHEDYLHETLSVEIASRSESAVKQRLRAAAFPEMKTLDQFDFGATEGVARSEDRRAGSRRVGWAAPRMCFSLAPSALARPTWRSRSASRPRVSVDGVAFWRAADLVRTLVEARDAKELGRYQRRLDRVDVLIVDEVGFVPFERHGGELLFNVLASRHGRHSVVITTNLAFAESPKVFGSDEKLTTALLDRLAERATVITTKGKSYRMRKRGTSDGPVAASEPEPTTSKTKEAKSR